MIPLGENRNLFIKINVTVIVIIWSFVLILIGFINVDELFSALKYLSIITFSIPLIYHIINSRWACLCRLARTRFSLLCPKDHIPPVEPISGI